MIDLHLHSTASDGALDPPALVSRVRAAGVRTLSLTDHDTMEGVPAAAAAAAEMGLEFIPGVEITAVLDRRDCHILGYFLAVEPPGLVRFLGAQRTARLDRARAIAAKLARLRVPIDIETLIRKAESVRMVVTRPLIARALVEAGHAGSMQETFDRWLGDGRPAFVSREGHSPAEVVRKIAATGGVAVLAHPGLLRRDELIPGLARAGLGGIEAHHSDHARPERARYAALAARHGLAVSGGSDYHGDHHHRAKYLGVVGPSGAELAHLRQRLQAAHRAVAGQAGAVAAG
ncbi:MAG: PHP domain-containing protein [Acidobacteria bacterium]|nr:PHP domain-containing protein [Acidobacteriota bacterium]